MKLAIIFGSASNEHDISIVSATSIIKNLDKEKYQITPIYLDKNNEFYWWKKNVLEIDVLKVGEKPLELEKIKDPFTYLKGFDLVWIMIHGVPGEDGTIAGILDFLKIKYIGQKPRASIVTMDKILTKEILEQNGILTTKCLAFTKYNDEFIYKNRSLNKDEVLEKIKEKIKYPLYLKASNSGSSIGVYRVLNDDELKEKLNEALKIDTRILVEEECVGQELECAVLEDNHEVKASRVGEVLAIDKFYSFDAKYHNPTENTIIPANIDKDIEAKIQKYAVQIFKLLECHGYSRCDFFLRDGQIYLNEINTIPGFTTISMYPKLFQADNIDYAQLLDIIIENA